MKKRKKKVNRKSIVKENLVLWSKCVKLIAKYRCERCNKKGTDKTLDSHHIYTKGSCSNLKYNLNNGVCLCKGYHRFKVHITNDPELIPLLIKKRGEDWFEELKRIKNSPTIHRSINDLRIINKALKAKLEHLKQNRSKLS